MVNKIFVYIKPYPAEDPVNVKIIIFTVIINLTILHHA
jgi:hypothetical protein